MIVIECEQGSPEWVNARLGIPTASRFSDIITPRTLKLSASSDKYMNELLAEWLLGRPVEDFDTTMFMDRGKQLEPEAIRFYELQRECDVTRVGFCLTDDRRYGCSPDGLVAQDGTLELKCPSPTTHVGYLLGEDMGKYNVQAQGQILVTGRAWNDRLSYHPEIPPFLLRTERDPVICEALAAALDGFCTKLQQSKERLLDLGAKPQEPYVYAA